MYMIFPLGAGIFWTATYVLIIRAGLRDRTYGMPVVAFAASIGWEFTFTFVRPVPGVRAWINLTWFCLDLAIGYTIVRYGRREFPGLPPRLLLPSFIGVCALAYTAMELISRELDHGERHLSAFADNVLISALFLAMLAARGPRGQSVGIAVTKLLGTACASLAMLTVPEIDPRYDNGLMYFLYFSCLVLDLAYVWAMVAVRRRTAPAEQPD
ncbi:hypothetical protein [Streptomyces clavuligerus]|uniref:Putative membrane protein n=1 Tax=Streptomyces clavuligerus TaxID=1901 RepID=B5GLY1_STRCL|nr:hypothetical protein [Streptomyces clavuligerus]EDY47327.1 conserved hypothetical protein [Streptomyces clavuligerus]EFG04986.1 Putative membrane protein [Streptomyces clavuligerus]MBY6306589.1 hypothetical protein [Streptomyces clavuligerus]QCS10805.1 hypothetical protein CRV15_35430 [Streptomyces clavuligerus]QPJ97160.1 hypothetical protein GE265_29055 [Streptomyces clavuligerus]